MITSKNYDTVAKPDWCPGCGNFGIQVAVKQALANLQIEPHNVAMVTGIGCGSKITHWVNCYGLHSLHGRSLPPAQAIKLVNPNLTVIASSGDGDGYGIGMGHFIHAMRRNIDMTYLVHNNSVYGLTKGQTTPTSQKGYVSSSTPFGAIEEPLNPISLALTMGASFVARGYAGDVQHLTKLIEQAISHKGFAIIDILQPCVTFNKINTYVHYLKNTYKLENEPNYNPSDYKMAYEKSLETERLPIGLFYKAEKPTYEEQEPGLQNQTNAVTQPIDNIDLTAMVKKYL